MHDRHSGLARLMAGAFAGTGGLVLLFLGEVPAGVGILSAMVGFFIGEANGRKKA